MKQESEKHICQCSKKLTSVYYDGPFYSITDVSCLCPECIATGTAASKYNGTFIGSTDYINDFNILVL